MVLHGLAAKAVATVVTGVAGAAAYDGAKRLVRGPTAHRVAVVVTAAGMRAARAAEVGAERVRLAVSDIASEAREQIGEQTPPPAGSGHAHEH